jgi:hypothetical protein
MRKTNIILICVLILLNSSCSPKFQDKYKATDKEDCKAFIDFLKTNFFRDKKDKLRTKKSYYEVLKSKESFDSLMLAPFRRELYGNNSNNCEDILRLEDFYAILGKPDYLGVHPVRKYLSCVYLIVAYPERLNCPCGKLTGLGSYEYKFKMGYRIAPYCRLLEIKFRSTDHSMFGYDFY